MLEHDIGFFQVTDDGPQNKVATRTFRYTFDTTRQLFQILGCKPRHAQALATALFRAMQNHSSASLTREQFHQLLLKCLADKLYLPHLSVEDVRAACSLKEQRSCIIVLLAGTSGTGKSTLATLMASRLGIKTVLSTDTIRHIIRSFHSKADFPFLWASTYQAGDAFDESRSVGMELLSHHERVIKGYAAQSEIVVDYLDRLIGQYVSRNEPLVCEGVHLNIPFVVSLMQKYNCIVPFLVYIAEEKKHIERMAVRARDMTLDPTKNKYVANMGNIRLIQEYLLLKADAHLVPQVDNSSMDESVEVMHTTLRRCLIRHLAGQPLFDAHTNTAQTIYSEYLQASVASGSEEPLEQSPQPTANGTHPISPSGTVTGNSTGSGAAPTFSSPASVDCPPTASHPLSHPSKGKEKALFSAAVPLTRNNGHLGLSADDEGTSMPVAWSPQPLPSNSSWQLGINSVHQAHGAASSSSGQQPGVNGVHEAHGAASSSSQGMQPTLVSIDPFSSVQQQAGASHMFSDLPCCSNAASADKYPTYQPQAHLGSQVDGAPTHPPQASTSSHASNSWVSSQQQNHQSTSGSNNSQGELHDSLPSTSTAAVQCQDTDLQSGSCQQLLRSTPTSGAPAVLRKLPPRPKSQHSMNGRPAASSDRQPTGGSSRQLNAAGPSLSLSDTHLSPTTSSLEQALLGVLAGTDSASDAELGSAADAGARAAASSSTGEIVEASSSAGSNFGCADTGSSTCIRGQTSSGSGDGPSSAPRLGADHSRGVAGVESGPPRQQQDEKCSPFCSAVGLATQASIARRDDAAGSMPQPIAPHHDDVRMKRPLLGYMPPRRVETMGGDMAMLDTLALEAMDSGAEPERMLHNFASITDYQDGEEDSEDEGEERGSEGVLKGLLLRHVRRSLQSAGGSAPV